MDFLDIMHSYFRGEKLEAAVFIVPVGLLFLGVAAGAWRSEHGGFLWGAAVPAALFGVALMGTGIVVAARTSGQVAGIERAYRQDAAKMVRQELPRMRRVMVLFSRTLPAFGVLALLGLGLRFGLRSDWAVALGAILLAAGGIGMVIDGFAERRAVPYVAALEALAQEHGVPVDTAP